MRHLSKILCSLILFCILPYWVVSQNFFDEYNPTILTRQEGLSSDMIFDILEDSNNLIWIATANGLNRYDGHNVKVYQHQSEANSINANQTKVLLEDHEGNIWVGTNGGGVSMYDYDIERFTHYQHDPDDPNTISNDEILAILEDKSHNIWIGTEDGLNRLNADRTQIDRYKTGTQGMSARAILSLHEDKYGRIWAGTWDGGINILTPTDDPDEPYNISILSHDPEDSRTISNQNVWGITEDRSGRIWIATFGGGICYVDNDRCLQGKCAPQELTFHSLTSADGLPIDKFFGIQIDKYDRLWLASPVGPSFLDLSDPSALENPVFQEYEDNSISVKSNLLNIECRDVMIDSQNTLWIGTMKGLGFASLDSPPLDNVSIEDLGFHFQVEDLLLDTINRLRYVATSTGLLIHDQDKDTYQLYEHPERYSGYDRIVSLFKKNDQTIWLGTRSGLSSFDLQSKTFKPYQDTFGLSNQSGGDEIWEITPYKDDKYWMVSEKGLFLTDLPPRDFEIFTDDPNNPKSLPHNTVSDILKTSSGDYWIAMLGGGIARIIKKENSFEFEPLDKLNLHNALITQIDFNKEEDILWIGSENGIGHYDFNENKYYPNSLTELTSRINGLIIDRFDRVWFNGPDGMFCYNPLTEKLSSFDHTDGVITYSNTYLSNRIIGEKIFLGGTNSYQFFDPAHVSTTDSVTSPIYITDLKVAGSSIQPLAKNKYGSKPILTENTISSSSIHLNHQHRGIMIEYALLDYKNAHRTKYAYRLKGLSDEWIESKERQAIFTSIPPGKYVFEVKAQNNHQYWSKAKTISISVTWPFWQRWWFIIGVLALVGISILSYLKYRTARITRDKEELENLILERTKQFVENDEFLPSDKRQYLTELLKTNEAYLTTLFNASPLGIMLLDKDLNIVRSNHRLLEYLQYKGYPIEDLSLERIAPKQLKVFKELVENKQLDERQTFRIEETIQINNQEIWLQVVSTILRDPEGEISNIIIMIDDISKRKEQENTINNLIDNIKNKNTNLQAAIDLRTKELTKTNEDLMSKNEELERFAFIASHDMKEPVRNISTYLTLLQKLRDDQKEKQKEYIDLANQNAKQLYALITDVLEYTRISKDEIKISDTDLQALVQNVNQSLSNQLQDKNAQIIFTSLPTIKSNGSFLYLVIKNLVENGIKFNESENPTINISYAQENDRHIIEVKDNGIGISEEYSKEIFQMFNRLHTKNQYAGTGLGLSICKKLIEKLDGDIRVVSDGYNGSAFVISLPAKCPVDQ